MKTEKYAVLFVAIFVLAIAFLANVSAYATINSVEVNDVGVRVGDNFVATAGDTLNVRVTFVATDNVSDVRIRAELSGAKDYSAVTERFDVISGGIYTKEINVKVPSNIEPDEPIDLVVSLTSRNDGEGPTRTVSLLAQRESYNVEILDVNMDTKVGAGEVLPLDIVLKNRGRHFAEDTFVKVRIPALGVEERAYFGDMSAVDQPVIDGYEDRLDKEDAAIKRILLKIPSNAKPGVYAVEIEAYNADSTSAVTKRVAVSGSSEESLVVSPVKSKTFKTGESAKYSITLVNSGNKVKVYQVGIDAPSGIVVNTDMPVIAVPAGLTQTVEIEASTDKVGVYDFTVTVQSGGELVSRESFIANVEKSGLSSATSIGGNATVLLTVILAIVFVVLLVVLIVLLTRKPEKQREIGESYY
jgi:preprotein translocase subunit SecG